MIPFTPLTHVVVRIETMGYYPGLFLACRKRVVTLRGETACRREALSASGSAQGLLRYTKLKTHRQIAAKSFGHRFGPLRNSIR